MESFKCENINVAEGELGIGLNELSKIEGNCYIEDESAYKTFHIGSWKKYIIWRKKLF